ncbi:MAG: TraR/DksA C4-type zinc finger protein [Chloroflexota bacterium]|nr:MAG: conjugal transfer protein TraR [Chloroflexota bacterium]
MLANDTLASIRKRLEDERADLQAQIDALEVENQSQQDDYGVGNHLADDASELFLRERNLALRGNAEELIAQIDAALKRIEDGTYGICARCGQPIAPERLEALPYVTLCITCQSAVERER